MAKPTAKEVVAALDAQNTKHTVHGISETEVQKYLDTQPERVTNGKNVSQLVEDIIAVRYTI